VRNASVLATLAAVGALFLFAPRANASTNLAANLIRETEDLSLTPYQDSGGNWHIGYGRLLGSKPDYDRITRQQAERWLIEDLKDDRTTVLNNVAVDLTPKQTAALTSLVYNIGPTAFRNSTLLRKLNEGNLPGAAQEFDRWIYVKGTPSSGLATRREAEKRLFTS